MAVTTEQRRPAAATRKVGYGVAVAVNAILLYAVNVWPGWEAVPFLTHDFSTVVGLVNASILVSLVANVVYLVRDPRWLRSLGDVATTAVGLVAVLRLWRVFPFDFGDSSFDWALVVHILLGVAIVGSAIGIVAGLVSFVRNVGRDDPVTR